ncbi:HDOD domain-containing protein,protein kinase family protein [Burkholderiales bacterium JOSHI_001]|nr:HDOD domain-containing protein,protein kinase family protein [Burkholderiales bacterium JOSHI_001]
MTVDPERTAAHATPPQAKGPRMFGRFQLLRLLGKSDLTMGWWVIDSRNGQEFMLVLPRQQPADTAALAQWMSRARQAGRINHPGLAPLVEVGEQDRWPFVAYDRDGQATLTEKLTPQGLPAADAARWISQALAGLAFAHEAGFVHRDLQPWQVCITEQGFCRVMGLEVALNTPVAQDLSHGNAALQQQRRGAERDVLAAGLVLHHALAGAPALEQTDVAHIIAQMPPLGREIVRLPWSTARPIPDPLRAIVNRATDRQERQRYRSARTLARALDGWRIADAEQGGGPLALLLDRLRAVGVLPGLPGSTARAARMALMERERTSELADVVLDDPALCFEMLRSVNTAQVRGAQVSGAGPVLTIRRTIAMIGMDGVRRCALALREWPGPLNEAAAAELERLIARVKHVGLVAQLLRPAGYDAEVVYLVALMQNLGRLVVQYHFPDEALQIRRLMQSAPAAKPGEPDDPGMSEEGAAFAVLGTSIEDLGQAVARHWGYDEEVLTLVRRHPLNTTPHLGDSDDELLRATASCANEVVDATQQPAAKVVSALQHVVQRYGRSLHVGLRELQLAAQGREITAEEHAHPARPAASPAPRAAGPAAAPAATAAASPARGLPPAGLGAARAQAQGVRH